MPTKTIEPVIKKRTGWRIPPALDTRIDREWGRRRARGIREAKEAFVALLLEAGLTAQKK